MPSPREPDRGGPSVAALSLTFVYEYTTHPTPASSRKILTVFVRLFTAYSGRNR